LRRCKSQKIEEGLSKGLGDNSRVVGKPEVIRLLPHRSSTGSNRDHFLQADFRVLIRTVPILDYFRFADHPGVIVRPFGQTFLDRL